MHEIFLQRGLDEISENPLSGKSFQNYSAISISKGAFDRARKWSEQCLEVRCTMPFGRRWTSMRPAYGLHRYELELENQEGLATGVSSTRFAPARNTFELIECQFRILVCLWFGSLSMLLMSSSGMLKSQRSLTQARFKPTSHTLENRFRFVSFRMLECPDAAVSDGYDDIAYDNFQKIWTVILIAPATLQPETGELPTLFRTTEVNATARAYVAMTAPFAALFHGSNRMGKTAGRASTARTMTDSGVHRRLQGSNADAMDLAQTNRPSAALQCRSAQYVKIEAPMSFDLQPPTLTAYEKSET